MSDGSEYSYQPIFDDRKRRPIQREPTAVDVGDRTAAPVYVFDDEIRLAINLALATGRPLLISGPSGNGKSSLARAVAALAQWSYVERTITSRVQARDLLYEIDHLKRLQDAQQNKLTGDERPYIVPGPLFWAFAPDKARELLEETERGKSIPRGIRKDASRSVVLLDEIDKADPDIPNDLLIPFGQLAFEITEIGDKVECPAAAVPLLMLTTNGERDLPPAFLRRCVELNIKAVENSKAGRDRLFAIVSNHGLNLGQETLDRLADAFFAAPRPERREPNAAEFLDLVRAWQQLQLKPDTDKSTLDAILAAITRGSQSGGS